MKVIMSTTGLARNLQKIPQGERVQYARYIDGKIIVKTNKGNIIEMHVPESSDLATAWLYHENVRWDWVLANVSKLPEQPMILELKERAVRIILDF